MKKIYTSILVISLIILTGCSLDTNVRRNQSAKQGNKITLYAACDSGADTVTALFMRDFAKRIEEKSNGKIEVETYSDSQVGSDTELLESCRSGNISFVFQTTAPQATLVKQASVFDIPMSFKNKEIARKVLDGKLLDILKPYYREKNIELLGFADQGFRQMTSNKKVEKFEDFKSIKIRTMENKNHIKFWNLVGANPTPMAYAEVYIGLQQGTIDAQENPLEAIIAPKFYEQQKYMIMTKHIIHAVSCIASKNVMDSLSDSDKHIILESINESKVWARNKTDERLENRMQIVKDNGTKILEIDDETYRKMKEQSNIVAQNLEKEIGTEIISTLKSEIEKAENN